MAAFLTIPKAYIHYGGNIFVYKLSFNLQPNFRQFIAERLAEEEIGALKEWFKMMDTDNNGTITFEELKNSLKEVKHELMDIEIKDLMDAVRKIVPPFMYYTFKFLIISCSSGPLNLMAD